MHCYKQTSRSSNWKSGDIVGMSISSDSFNGIESIKVSTKKETANEPNIKRFRTKCVYIVCAAFLFEDLSTWRIYAWLKKLRAFYVEVCYFSKNWQNMMKFIEQYTTLMDFDLIMMIFRHKSFVSWGLRSLQEQTSIRIQWKFKSMKRKKNINQTYMKYCASLYFIFIL